MKSIGRGLQIMSLVLLPASMLLELDGSLGRPFGVSDMVVMLVFGICAFSLGRMMEGYARA